MASAGVYCPLTVHGLPNHARLAAALCDRNHDPETLKHFRAALRTSPHGKVFISGEALFSITREGMKRLKRLLDGRELRVLAYVRDYPGWVQSMYAQRTKRANSPLDFDAYFKSIRANVTILPRVERWASSFGWDVMRIRTLDPAVLTGGNLIADMLDALSITATPPNVQSLNVSPHWIALELQRALAAASPIGKIDSKSARTTRNLFEACAAGAQPSRVDYLTNEQWRELALLYMQDMAKVGERIGARFPISLKEPGERQFRPSFANIPGPVKADILSKIREPRLASQINPAVLALVEKLLMDGYELPLSMPAVARA